MTELPWEMRLSLRQGNVYKMVHRNLHSPLPHYFIVVSQEPTSSEILLLTVVTSKVEKVRIRRKDQADETLVELDPNVYSELSMVSMVDCNEVFREPLKDFISKFHSGELENCDPINDQYLKLILQGINASDLVSNKIKNDIN